MSHSYFPHEVEKERNEDEHCRRTNADTQYNTLVRCCFCSLWPSLCITIGEHAIGPGELDVSARSICNMPLSTPRPPGAYGLARGFNRVY